MGHELSYATNTGKREIIFESDLNGNVQKKRQETERIN